MLDLHNIESVLHARCASRKAGRRRWRIAPFKIVCRDLEEEMAAAIHLFAGGLRTGCGDLCAGYRPNSQVSAYPNAIPLIPAPTRRAEEVIAFSGNLEYHPNVSAVRYFRRRIWPLSARSLARTAYGG